MCSYNRVNGVFASEDPFLLTQVLRDEWGFEGLVVSDWGAVNDRVSALAAGLDLEMPSSGGVTDAQVVDAVRDGSLAESVVDASAERIAHLATRWQGTPRVAGPLDVDAHHALAREAAGRSIVLLKNDGGLLPLRAERSVALIGAFVDQPRFQGAGSSMINPTRIDSVARRARDQGRRGPRLPGAGILARRLGRTRTPCGRRRSRSRRRTTSPWSSSASRPPPSPRATTASTSTCRWFSSQLLDAVLEVNPDTVVVLSNGSVVALPFADEVSAILEGWLLGQAGGGAIADVLCGDVNPSAKLTETVPVRLEDSPAFLSFPGEDRHVRYGEGLFVGYRWYDARKIEVTFPFGHGLSYTTFGYGDATASVGPDGDVEVRVTVTNTGDRAGREVVQVYTGLASVDVQRPVRELKAFGIVALEPGESREVVLTVRRADLAYWHVRTDRWVVEGGRYTVDVAASSRDLRSSTTVEVVGDTLVVPLTRESSLAEVFAHPVAGPIVQQAMGQAASAMEGASILPEGVDMMRMLGSFPIGRIGMIAGDGFGPEQIDQLLATANGAGA